MSSLVVSFFISFFKIYQTSQNDQRPKDTRTQRGVFQACLPYLCEEVGYRYSQWNSKRELFNFWYKFFFLHLLKLTF